MNREETRKAIEVMQAYVDGEEIEYRADERWYSTSSPVFNWEDSDYRIKHKPREWDVLEDDDGFALIVRQEGEGERGWIKVREVLE